MRKEKKESAALRFLYRTRVGRILLKPLTCRFVSRVAGTFLDSGASRFLIQRFVKKYRIDLSEYEAALYPSFNAFFTRRIRPECRPIDPDPEALISPCDAFLTVVPLKDGTVLPLKQSEYTLTDLLKDEKLAKRYQNGWCLVFRLCVDHYHRYAFPDSGKTSAPVFIKGKLHTVRPIALETLPVFVRNSRSYQVLETAHFGRMIQMEIGALLVGKIVNHPVTAFSRGQEKGLFLYGGSTVILLLERDAAAVLPEFIGEEETPVRLGQKIAIVKMAE